MNNNKFCPYCLVSDCYHNIFIPINSTDGYNKCLHCNKWSLHEDGEQKELPENITNEELNNQTNNL